MYGKIFSRYGELAAVTRTTSTPRKDSTLHYGALFVAPLAMETSSYNFPVAAEVLRLQKAAVHNLYLSPSEEEGCQRAISQ
jgi:hypothetical protein